MDKLKKLQTRFLPLRASAQVVLFAAMAYLAWKQLPYLPAGTPRLFAMVFISIVPAGILVRLVLRAIAAPARSSNDSDVICTLPITGQRSREEVVDG